jgi:hypothetical protein
MPSDREPVALMDTDLAAETIEPLVTLMLDQLALDMGVEALRSLLPIDVSVTFRPGANRPPISQRTDLALSAPATPGCPLLQVRL